MRSRRGAPEVVILTTFDADEHVLRALRAGAAGFVLKDTPPHDILAEPQQPGADRAARARSRGDDIDTLTTTIPLIVGLVGLVLILVAAAELTWGRQRARRQDA